MSGKLLVGSKYSTNCGTNLTIVEDSGWDSDIFSKESIESVIMELPDDLNIECYSCGGELNPREALVGEKECKDCIIRHEQLFKYET